VLSRSADTCKPVSEFLDHPGAPPDPEVLAALQSPIDPAAALPLARMDRLLDPNPLARENGWCWTAEHVGFVAVRTALPGHAAEMWDWWFDWHPRENVRYQIWYPQAHFATGLRPPATARAKPFWGATHFPDEDVGVGREVIRIEFKAPTEYGFSTDALDDPRVGTIVGGHVGSATRHLRVGVVTHVFLRSYEGLTLRSRFWLGAGLRPDLPGRVGDLLGRVLDRPAARRRLPADLPRALAHHCAHEYARLGAMLPELYARYA
jgi:phloretin hydrolase